MEVTTKKTLIIKKRKVLSDLVPPYQLGRGCARRKKDREEGVVK